MVSFDDVRTAGNQVEPATARELQQHPTSSSPSPTDYNNNTALPEPNFSDYTGSKIGLARYVNHLELPHSDSLRDLGSFILKWFILKRRVSD